MCQTGLAAPSTVLDESANPFAERMLTLLNDAALALMISVGHRTALFDVMAKMEPATGDQIAERAGLNERYVREWLGAMVTGGIINHEPAHGLYHLPAQHAAFLTRAARPNNMAATAQFISVLGQVEDDIVEAFRRGGGVPYEKYPRFHEVMAEESDQTVVAGLREHILPLVDGLVQRLEQGMEVVDIGCGSGRAMIELATLFPRSRFTGLDFSKEAITRAIDEASRRGLTNVSFQVCDVAELSATAAYDLVTAFDAIHDQARPAEVLHNIRRALRPGGVFLMQDIAACSHVHDNIGRPLSPFIYTISCMHCMTVSLANNGAGLGAAWGRERAVHMLREAGFENVVVKELEHDIMNYYYVCRV